MQEDIQISAVIPTFNRGKTVGRAIESVLAQEHLASEIIVIDDGSRDDTRKIVGSYDGKCRYVYQENAGVSVARNRGVDNARHEWIAFLDSDDYWVPQHLSRLASAIEATNGEAALYFCDIQHSPEDAGISHWDYCGFKISPPYLFTRDASTWALMRIQPMLLQASVIKRTRYLDIGGLPSSLRTREDTLLFFKLGLLYPACAVSGCGTVMTSDGSMRLTSEIGSSNLSYWQATLAISKEMFSIASSKRPEYRKYFTEMLSATYFSLGRLFYREKKHMISISNLIHSALKSPSMFTRCLLESLQSRIFKK